MTRQIPFSPMLPVFWWFSCTLLFLWWWKRGMALLVRRAVWIRGASRLGLCHVLNALLPLGPALLFILLTPWESLPKPSKFYQGLSFLFLVTIYLPSLPKQCPPSILTAIQYCAPCPAQAHPLEAICNAYLWTLTAHSNITGKDGLEQITLKENLSVLLNNVCL